MTPALQEKCRPIPRIDVADSRSLLAKAALDHKSRARCSPKVRVSDGEGGSDTMWAPWSCRCREGNYFPSLLEPRRRSERDLLAVVQQVYLEGVSTRRV